MKKITKLISLFLSMIMLLVSVPMNVFASGSLTHNYSDIKELNSKYSYGTVFWSDKSELLLTENNTASKCLVNSTYNYYIDAKFGEVAEAKLTNCAVDEDGNICDVILRVDNITPFSEENQNNTDALGVRHNDLASDKSEFLRADLNIRKYTDSDLMLIWFRTNSSSADFTMKYVLSGTDKPANINGTVATIYDIDVQKEDKVGEIWNGNEGFTAAGSDAEIYYLKNNWLIDTPDDKGVRCPDYSAGSMNFEDTNSLIPENSAVVAESFDDATFRLFYSGYSCGIAYSFASPYPFTVDNPVKAVDKSEAYEGDTLKYTVSQYIPNNYYSSKLSFIENIDNWNSLTIKDKFDEGLEINSDSISIYNELGEDASAYFNLSVDTDNTVVAAATAEALNTADFYSHLYTLKVSAVIKDNIGLSTISNRAVTQVNQAEYQSNSVTTNLIYRIDTTILNGTITQSMDKVNSGDSKTVNFQPNKDYYVSSITVDGQDVNPAAYKNGGTYSFSNVNANHRIDVVCTAYEWYNVNIIYVDENGKEIAEPFNQSVRAETDYNVTAEANKDIQYYTLKSIEGITKGMVNGNVNIIVRYARNTNNITIHYVDKLTGEGVADTFTQVFSQGTNYSVIDTANKEIACYALDSIEGQTEGIITQDIEITVYYVTKDTSVVVNFIDTEGNILADSDTINGKVFDTYFTSAKDIYGYELTSVPANATGIMTENSIIVVYVYELKNSSVVVNYKDTEGNSLADNDLMNGKVFDEYVTAPKDIPYYSLTVTPDNAEGTMTEESIIVDYIYSRNQNTLTINYIDKDNGETLAESFVQTFSQGTSYDLSEQANKAIPHYRIESIDQDTSGLLTEDVTINVYYVKNSGKVIVKYVDAQGKELAEAETIEGKVEEPYDTAPKSIDDYELISTPDNKSGAFTEDDITVIYVYEKIEQLPTEILPQPEESTPETIEKPENSEIDASAEKVNTGSAVVAISILLLASGMILISLRKKIK